MAVALAALQARTDSLHDDYSAVLNEARYRTQAQVEGVEPMTQDVSCGYAVIEMFSSWDSLEAGVPVPFEWAARRDGEWTLHYSLITGMDLARGRVTVANPYGYTETPSLDEFLSRTSFEVYANMPLYLKLGFGTCATKWE